MQEQASYEIILRQKQPLDGRLGTTFPKGISNKLLSRVGSQKHSFCLQAVRGLHEDFRLGGLGGVDSNLICKKSQLTHLGKDSWLPSHPVPLPPLNPPNPLPFSQREAGG